jgi:GNAT superfamily N-acetyltransferase
MDQLLQKKAEWLLYVQQQVAAQKSGSLFTKDKKERPVSLTWHASSIIAPECPPIMQSLADVAAAAYVPVELNFLKKHPEAVNQDDFLKRYQPFFTYPNAVDWKGLEGQIGQSIRGIYQMDLSQLSEQMLKKFQEDIYFFVTVRDLGSDRLLGFVTFSVTPAFGAGDVKVISLAISPADQNCGLAKILMSSIFCILPKTQRIFLCTRATNEVAIRAYTKWGFVVDQNPIKDPHHTFAKNHWIFMEYMVGKSGELEKVATNLKG